MKILVIGDSHTAPGQDLRRIDALGKWILKNRPDVVVDIGDWASMDSISVHGGRASMEGQRYAHDIETSVGARKRLMAPVDRYNARRADGKHKQWKPRWISTTGNHENRVHKVLEQDPQWIGSISLEDHKREEMGWETYPYMQPVIVEGVAFSHCFASGVMGRSLGGEHPATMVLNKMHMSCVFGHSHLYNGPAIRTRADGHKIMGLNCGCFFEHTEGYAGPQVNPMWWRGVVVLHDVKDGIFDVEQISLARLLKEYL